MGPCMLGHFGHISSPCMAKHTYNFLHVRLLFTCFLMFLSKNVALAVEMEIRVFEKATDVPCWLYISMACIGKHTWICSFEVVRNLIDELKRCLSGCMYVCSFSRKNWSNLQSTSRHTSFHFVNYVFVVPQN